MDEALARRALPRWGLDDAVLRFVSARENIVHEVIAPAGERYALRIHRPGYHTWAELVSEHAWTGALQSAGIDVPPPVSTLDGEPYARVLGDDGVEQVVGLIGWCPGVPMAQVMDRPGERLAWFERLGALAAGLHRHAETWPLPDGFVRHHLDADGLMGPSPWWGPFWEAPEWSADERAEIDLARPVLHAWLSAQPRDRSRYGIIHADLLPHNVLADGDRLSAIDFDDAGFGWYLYDIAVALVGSLDASDRDDVFAAFFAGYRSVRPLADEVIAALAVFLLCRTLATIGWYHTRLQGTIVNGAGKTLTRDEVIRPLLDSALRQWRQLDLR